MNKFKNTKAGTEMKEIERARELTGRRTAHGPKDSSQAGGRLCVKSSNEECDKDK